MAKITLPPRKEAQTTQAKKAAKPNEKKIQAVISKGGSTTKQAGTNQEEEAFKNFNVKLLESELETINELREKRPKPRGGKRLGISLHDWIVEAIQEKIERERKSFKV